MAEPTVAPSQSGTGTNQRPAKRAAIYTRVSTADQHPETQLYDLREMAKQRRYEIVREYSDVISGAKSKRPGLDQLMADARRRRFDVVLVAAFDRVARSVRHFLVKPSMVCSCDVKSATTETRKVTPPMLKTAAKPSS